MKYRETGDLINVSQDRAHDVGLQSNLISTTIMQMRQFGGSVELGMGKLHNLNRAKFGV